MLLLRPPAEHERTSPIGDLATSDLGLEPDSWQTDILSANYTA